MKETKKEFCYGCIMPDVHCYCNATFENLPNHYPLGFNEFTYKQVSQIKRANENEKNCISYGTQAR